jgi:hypothetical protein
VKRNSKKYDFLKREGGTNIVLTLWITHILNCAYRNNNHKTFDGRKTV